MSRGGVTHTGLREMDLGYSSSDSSGEEEAEGRNAEPEVKDLEIGDIFRLKDIKPTMEENEEKMQTGKKRIRTDLDDIISKVVSDKVILDKRGAPSATEEDSDRKRVKNDKTSGDNDKEREYEEFDINQFYQANRKEIESGHLDDGKIHKSRKVEYYGGGDSTEVGRLANIIKFNMNNSEKITYQNTERIKREKQLKSSKN